MRSILLALLCSPFAAYAIASAHGGGAHATAHVSPHTTVSEHVSVSTHATASEHATTVGSSKITAGQLSTLPKPTRSFANTSIIHRNNTNNTDYDPLYVTVCTNDELKAALVWEALCEKDGEVDTPMCPILSYFRYCEATTIDDVDGLQKVKSTYRNVYLR